MFRIKYLQNLLALLEGDPYINIILHMILYDGLFLNMLVRIKTLNKYKITNETKCVFVYFSWGKRRWELDSKLQTE